MRLPDVVAGFDGISPHLTCITPLFPFLTPYLATPPQDVKTYFCSLLCRFAMPTPTPLSSALHLHLYRLPLLWYYPPRAYSKMFVGGLSWDTTDGTYLISTQLSYPYLQCYVHFTNLLNLCGGGRVMSFFFFFIPRGLAKLLYRVRQSRRLHNCPGRRWQVTRFCLPHVRRSGFGERRHGPRAFSRWEGRPCAHALLNVTLRF